MTAADSDKIATSAASAASAAMGPDGRGQRCQGAIARFGCKDAGGIRHHCAGLRWAQAFLFLRRVRSSMTSLTSIILSLTPLPFWQRNVGQNFAIGNHRTHKYAGCPSWYGCPISTRYPIGRCWTFAEALVVMHYE